MIEDYPSPFPDCQDLSQPSTSYSLWSFYKIFPTPAQQDTNYDNTVTKFSRNDITSMGVHVLQAGPLQGLEFQGRLIVL